MTTTAHHQVVIVGGGTAGISVAARLRHAGIRDIGLIDPATTHYYQPLWNAGGLGSVGAPSGRGHRSPRPSQNRA